MHEQQFVGNRIVSQSLRMEVAGWISELVAQRESVFQVEHTSVGAHDDELYRPSQFGRTVRGVLVRDGPRQGLGSRQRSVHGGKTHRQVCAVCTAGYRSNGIGAAACIKQDGAPGNGNAADVLNCQLIAKPAIRGERYRETATVEIGGIHIGNDRAAVDKNGRIVLDVAQRRRGQIH